MHLRFFLGFQVHYFFVLINIPLFNISYEESSYKHLCAGFCVDIHFLVPFWVNTKEHDCWIICKIVFNFLRNWQAVFQSGCTISHTHQQWMWVPVAPQSHQHLLSSVFQILTILIGGWWYLSVVLINLHFLDDVQTWSIFSYAYLPAVYLLWWGVFKSLDYFLIR